MSLIDVSVLKEWVNIWVAKNRAYHPYAKNNNIPITELYDILEQIPTIEREPKWIPCSNVPDTDRNVFMARGEHGNMTVCIGHYNHDYKQWYVDRDWFAMCSYNGLYWCEMPPLPEPYRE